MSLKVANEVTFTVLEDGTVSVDTDEFDEEVHLEAEQLIDAVFDELGGERKILRRKPHKHGHGHVHTHQKVRR